MSDENTYTLKNLLKILVFATIFSISIFLIINYFIQDKTEVLKISGTILAGLGFIINAFFAAQRADAMNKTAIAANINSQMAQDRQITEPFSKAIEQLGSEKIEIRLGAIYTLERIAKYSSKDHWTIMEILTAFVRENAPLNQENQKNEKSLIILLNIYNNYEIKQNKNIPTDIQAALTVIARRDSTKEEENQKLKLSNINIAKANLKEANLQGAYLYNANLQEANLKEANLKEANLMEANLMEANLERVNLYNANLYNANLYNANLYNANLCDANILGANLQKANLMETNFKGACLAIAKLQRANLYKANLMEAKLHGTNLQGAYLKEAYLQGTDLERADLRGAESLTVEQIKLATNWEMAIYDPEISKVLGLADKAQND
jgi:uncharacterized protein YjbI with pentapeptide repeats